MELIAFNFQVFNNHPPEPVHRTSKVSVPFEQK